MKKKKSMVFGYRAMGNGKVVEKQSSEVMTRTQRFSWRESKKRKENQASLHTRSTDDACWYMYTYPYTHFSIFFGWWVDGVEGLRCVCAFKVGQTWNPFLSPDDDSFKGGCGDGRRKNPPKPNHQPCRDFFLPKLKKCVCIKKWVH